VTQQEDFNPYLWEKAGTPDPEIARLESLLQQYRHQEPLRPLTPPRRARLWLRIAAPAFALVVLAAFILYTFQHRLHWTPGAPWQVQALAGAPRVGGAVLRAAGLLPVGEYLETDAASRARLAIGNIGNLEVQPGSRLRLLETRSGRHRIALEHGTVDARLWAPPFSFGVETPSSTLFDVGCAFTLHVEPNGYGVVRVTSGWVQFELDDRQTLIPAGAEAITRPNIGPGTPYFSDASPTLKAALAQFDSNENDAAVRAAMVDAILADAHPHDAFTLLNLLRKVPQEQRGRIFDRLAQLVPPPPGATREAMIELQQPALDAYWKALGLGNVKSWMVHWKDSLGAMQN